MNFLYWCDYYYYQIFYFIITEGVALNGKISNFVGFIKALKANWLKWTQVIVPPFASTALIAEDDAAETSKWIGTFSSSLPFMKILLILIILLLLINLL